MPRILMEKLVPKNYYNNLVNELLKSQEHYIFYTVTGVVRKNIGTKDIIPDTRPDKSLGSFVHGEHNVVLAICPGWIPIYTPDNLYLGFEAGTRHYRPVWGDREDAEI